MSKRAALYSRVSDTNQEDNTSLDAQLRACREFAIAQGWTIVREVKEVMSGIFVLARPEFNGLLEIASQGKIDIIVVDIPDRFGRGDAVAKLELLAEMSGAQIAYVKRRFDDSTVEGFVQKSTDILVSGIERIKIAERTANGRRNRAREGRVIASPYRPYGYRYVSEYDERGKKISCMLEIVEDEAEVVRQMFDWYVYNSLSAYAITLRLAEEKIPTMADKGESVRKKPLREKYQWSRSTVCKMLKNETYVGIWRYGKRKTTTHDGKKVTTTSERRSNDDPNCIAVGVPAIIDRETYDLAQAKFAETKRRGAFRPTVHKYLLRSLCFCAQCGARLAGWTPKKKSGISYYRCGHNRPDLYKQRCMGRQLRADKAEVVVWDYIREVMLDEDELFDQVQQRRDEAKVARNALVINVAALDAQDEKDRQKLDRFLDLYAEGGITKDVYLQRQRRIDADIEKREFERADLQARLSASGVLSEDAENELRKLREKIVKGLDSADFDSKRQLLEILKVRCVWNDKTSELTVSGLFGDGQILSITS